MFARIIQSYRRWNDANNDIAALPWLLLAVIIVLSVLTGGAFLSPSNILNLVIQIPELGLLSLAMMVTMVTAGINLSIISSANLSAVVMALVLTQFVPEGSGSGAMIVLVCVAILIGLLVSVFLGLVNGILIAYIEVPAVLATLGTMILFEGITLAITRGFVISGLPEAFLVIGNARILGIPMQMYIFALVVGVMTLIIKKRPYGTYLYMLGSNPIATRFSGIDVRRVLVKTYVLSGILAGIAAIIMLSRFNSANARQGSSLLLLTVLICMLGGTDPFGGFGKISGLVIALVILQMVTSGLNLLGVRSFATVAIWGVLLIGVMAYRYVQHRRWEAKGKKAIYNYMQNKDTDKKKGE